MGLCVELVRWSPLPQLPDSFKVEYKSIIRPLVVILENNNRQQEEIRHQTEEQDSKKFERLTWMAKVSYVDMN